MWEALDMFSRLLIVISFWGIALIFCEPKSSIGIWLFSSTAGVAVVIHCAISFLHPRVLAWKAGRLERRINKTRHQIEEIRGSLSDEQYGRALQHLLEADKHTQRQWYPFGCTAQDLANWIRKGHDHVDQARQSAGLNV